MNDVTITVEIGIAVWGISFCAGFILGAVLRATLFVHTVIAAALFIWQIGRQGMRHYIMTLVDGWVVGLIVVSGAMPGYLCGYFAADALYKQLATKRN